MRSIFVVLLAVCVSVLATAKGLLAADCDSTPEDLLLLDDTQYLRETMHVEHSITPEGVVRIVYSPQHFIIQMTLCL